MNTPLQTYGIRFVIISFWIVLFGCLLMLSRCSFYPQGPVLTIFTWGEMLDAHAIALFEKETGIRVQLSFYNSNEELVAKLSATRGEGYDLIVPSDYAIVQLSNLGLLQPLDHSKMPFLSDINPLLRNHAYDPDLRFSVPFSWELTGIGYDASMLEQYAHSSPDDIGWDYIFKKPENPYLIVMTNDEVEAVALASQYLYGTLCTLGSQELDGILCLLKAQKKWVEAYSSMRPDYFLITGSCPFVVAASSHMIRARRVYNNARFVIPRDKGLVAIDSFALPSKGKNTDLVYRFMAFMYRPDIQAMHTHSIGQFPATVSAQSQVHLHDDEYAWLTMTKEKFSTLSFIRPCVSPREEKLLWIAVKS